MNITFSKLLSSIYLGFEMLRLWTRGLFNDRIIRILIIVLLVLQLSIWGIAIILVQSIGSALAVLHYNVVFGIDKVGEASLIYLTPVSILIILIINLIFASYCLASRQRNAALIILGVSIFVHIFTILALYFSYLSNFS